MKLGTGYHVICDAVHQRLQQPADLAEPVGHARAADLDTLSSIDLRLAIKRQVISELGDDDVRQQSRPERAAPELVPG